MEAPYFCNANYLFIRVFCGEFVMSQCMILFCVVYRIESRYLLILTENLSVLSIILDKFKSHDRQPEVVFGSKFPEDVSYTQVTISASYHTFCH